MILYPDGRVEVSTMVNGVGLVTGSFYPLCGNAVQTEVFDGASEIRVRPDTFTKRAVMESYGV